MLRQVLLLSFVVGAFAGGFNNDRFGGFGSQEAFDRSKFQSQDNSAGNAASAGQAGVGGAGNAQSINTADHQGDGKRTQSNAVSANTAQGSGGVNAGGAAQAGGQTASQKAGQRETGFNSQIAQPVFTGGNFGGFPNGQGGGFSHGRGGQIGGFPNQGFPSGNLGGTSGGRGTESFNKGSNSGGTSAGAGNAAAGGPNASATSINTADQSSDENGDRESGSSANAAQGWQPNTSGAAQAGGNTDKFKQGSRQNHNFNSFGGF